MGISVNVDISNHFKVGHNWGALLGSSLVKDRPDWFSRLVILNTNNLPDGEVNPDRFHRKSDFSKFLIFDLRSWFVTISILNTFHLLDGGEEFI